MLACRLARCAGQVNLDFTDGHLPPRVGCSIFITSALGFAQLTSIGLPTSGGGSYWVIYRVPKVAQNLCTIWLRTLVSSHYGKILILLTPARTRVMSNTLMPAKGSVAASLL
jgi:hypothetical protein